MSTTPAPTTQRAPGARIVPARPPSLQQRVLYDDPEHYAKNPDLCLLEDGRLLCVFLEADQHVPFRYARIVLLESIDQGRSWGRRRVLAESAPLDNWGAASSPEREPWVTPRIRRLRDGRLVINCDKDDNMHKHESQPSGIYVWWSGDAGETWSAPANTGIPGIEPDKVVELRDGTLLMGHHFMIASTQRYAEAVSRSSDGGRSWGPSVVIASDDVHAFCEGSIVELPSGRLVCVMRENNHNNYPCYLSFSDDGARTWSPPVEAPFSGDRPYSGLLADGRFLVTYPDQAGRPVTNAWIGDVEREHGYKVCVAGRNVARAAALTTAPLASHRVNIPSLEVARNQHLVALDGECLRLRNAFETPVRYHLLPPDTVKTQVTLEAELRLEGDGDGVQFLAQVARVGIYLQVAAQSIRVAPGLGTHGWYSLKPMDMTVWRTVRVRHEGGLVEVSVDGEAVTRALNYREGPWDRTYFGTAGARTGTVALRRVRYATRDGLREHEWAWDAATGEHPNQYEIDRWLTLAECPEAFPDHGYTAWVQLPDGQLLVVESTCKSAPFQKSQIHAYFFMPPSGSPPTS